MAPSSPWVMNYAEDSCHLSRTFGTGDSAVTVEFREFAPGNRFELMIAGKALEAKGRSSLLTEFGPEGTPTEDMWALRGQLPDGRFVLETSGRLLKVDDSGKSAKPEREDAKSSEELAPPKVDREAEAKVTQLRIGGPIPRDLLLQLGPMDKPMDAMRACLDELLTHWGIDVVAHHALTRVAGPTSDPRKWLQPDDYPKEMLLKRRSGVVHFRIMIDAWGMPTDCIVQTGGSDFDKLTCSLLMKRAHFVPALDAMGKPIPSYFTNSVRWLA